MDYERTIETLRDAVIRRRSGLPLPNGLDVDALLEAAAETIEDLLDPVDEVDDEDEHCDGCTCDDEPADLEKTLAPIRARLRAAIDRASDAVDAIEDAIDGRAPTVAAAETPT